MVIVDESRIDPHIAATTLWFFGDRSTSAYSPSHWRTVLLELISLSDEGHLASLETIYPGEVAAVRLAKTAVDGIDALKRIANPSPLAGDR